jgi:hypothetical protein
VCDSRADSIAGVFVAVGRSSHDPRRDGHCLPVGLIVRVAEVVVRADFAPPGIGCDVRRLYAARLFPVIT